MDTIDLNELPDEDKPNVRDEDDPGEVPTSFATKGTGWSGREGDDGGDPPE